MISSLYLHSNRRDRPPLRIGVLVDSFHLPRVFRQVLTDIGSADFARLSLVVVNRQPLNPSLPDGKLARYFRLLREPARRRRLLYSLYQKLDRHCESPNPLEEIDCTDILGGIERLDVVPITQRFVHRFPPEAIAALRAQNLDVLLRFGFNILRGEILTSARHGTWSFHHGDNEFYRGGPALFWEVVEDNPSSGVVLQVLTEKLDDGLVLCKSLFPTERGLWASRNVFAPYWGSAHQVIRKLHQLHERGWNSLKEHALPPRPYRGKKQIYRAPTNFEMMKWLAPKGPRKLVGRLNPLRREKVYQWRICLSRAASRRMLSGPSGRWTDFKWVASPEGHFYADPFLFERAGQVWLFFEDYLYESKRAAIRCGPILPDLSLGPSHLCLDSSCHRAYPLIFSEDGEIFMIPESEANGSVELWRATQFPYSWKLEKVLFYNRVMDTTPFHHEGRWYFFTTFLEPGTTNAFGALFFADRLTGEWTLHPSSPISTSVADAGSAGPIQVDGNRILRPVQDCSRTYGGRILIQEILELTPTTLRERRLHSIEPDWEKGLVGVHTYGYCGGIEVLDAVRFEDRRKICPPARNF